MAKKKNPQITLKQSENAFVLFFTVMHDKHGYGQKRLARLFKEVEYLASMVNETPHTVTIEQLKKALRDETRIDFT